MQNLDISSSDQMVFQNCDFDQLPVSSPKKMKEIYQNEASFPILDVVSYELINSMKNGTAGDIGNLLFFSNNKF